MFFHKRCSNVWNKMAEKSGKMSDEPEDKMAGGSDTMAERSEWKTEVEWQGKITEK